MKKFSALFAVFALCAVAVTIFTTGCETESADEVSISINPSYAKLRVGQSITLTASGGWNYKWEVENQAIGSISANSGSKVVYTAHQAGENTVTVTGVDSNTTYKATAKMVVAGESKTGDSSSSKSSSNSTPGASLKIASTKTTLAVDEKTTLSASGGTGYTWDLSNGDYGELSSLKGDNVTYTAKKEGVTQIVYLRGTVSGVSKTESIEINQK